MDQARAFPRDYPQLGWFFSAYLDGMMFDQTRFGPEIRDSRDTPFKTKLAAEMDDFVQTRPLRLTDYENSYQIDFASEDAFYTYIAAMRAWLFGQGDEPAITDYLAD